MRPLGTGIKNRSHFVICGGMKYVLAMQILNINNDAYQRSDNSCETSGQHHTGPMKRSLIQSRVSSGKQWTNVAEEDLGGYLSSKDFFCKSLMNPTTDMTEDVAETSQEKDVWPEKL